MGAELRLESVSALILIRRVIRPAIRHQLETCQRQRVTRMMNIAAEKSVVTDNWGQTSRQNDEIRLKNIFLDHS